ncbi:small ribosomal subunit protein eS27-like [Dipodomys merriami]|uniref:small ribosomal subunit protein eS27-like n=1 Tax=Dipodomys merriami TaxID=94247 RepID=UPI00384F68C8
MSHWCLAKIFCHKIHLFMGRRKPKRNLNYYFLGVKCPGCHKTTMVFTHVHTVLCIVHSRVPQSTGGRAKAIEGLSFRKKQY